MPALFACCQLVEDSSQPASSAQPNAIVVFRLCVKCCLLFGVCLLRFARVQDWQGCARMCWHGLVASMQPLSKAEQVVYA